MFFVGVNTHYGVEVWCEAIDIFSSSSSLKLLHIPDVGEAKLYTETSQMDKHVYIELIDRAKVCIDSTT